MTDPVTSEAGWKHVVASGQPRQFLVTVTPGSGVAAGEKYKAWVRAEAKRDPYQCDVIKMVTTMKEE